MFIATACQYFTIDVQRKTGWRLPSPIQNYLILLFMTHADSTLEIATENTWPSNIAYERKGWVPVPITLATARTDRLRPVWRSSAPYEQDAYVGTASRKFLQYMRRSDAPDIPKCLPSHLFSSETDMRQNVSNGKHPYAHSIRYGRRDWLNSSRALLYKAL